MLPHYRTVIVDDEKASTYWLSEVLTEFPQISILSIENSPPKALEIILELKPDLLFLDIEMPVYSGFELLKIINKADLFPKVIFITAYQKYAIRAIKVMAFDYLLKPIDIDELRKCMTKLMSRSHIKAELKIPNIILIESFTPREEEIFRYLVEGMTSQEIAHHLYIGKSTVDSHRKSILLKTQARNSAELIVWGALEYFA